MLDIQLKDVIGKKFYYADINEEYVSSGLCTGVVLSDRVEDGKTLYFLLVYLKDGDDKRSLDYKHVHVTKADAEKHLKKLAPHAKECNRIVSEATAMVNQIRTEFIVGEPYLVIEEK